MKDGEGSKREDLMLEPVASFLAVRRMRAALERSKPAQIRPLIRYSTHPRKNMDQK
jgi:hypothetical protein